MTAAVVAPTSRVEPFRRSAAALRARVAVIGLFILLGAAMGSWAARIPSIRQQVVLTDAEWGAVSFATPVGTLLALLLIARIIPRTGARRLAMIGAAAIAVSVPVTATSTSVAVLVGALVVQGMSAALLATPMNTLAVLVERSYARRIISTFHAWFSLGQLVGGGLSAVAAANGISPALQIAAINTVLGLGVVGTVRWLPADRPVTPAAAGPRRADGRRTGPRATSVMSPQLMLLAVLALLACINEGVAVQWSAQYGAVTLAAGAGAGALLFSTFTLAMVCTRIFGDRIAGRLGAATFLRLSALVSATGMAVALLLGTTWAGFIGFALLGVGSACVVPTLMGLAGNQPGLDAGRGVAVVSFGQWPAFLIGPPLIGALAGTFGLRLALVLLVGCAVAIAVLAGRVRDTTGAMSVAASDAAATRRELPVPAEDPSTTAQAEVTSSAAACNTQRCRPARPSRRHVSRCTPAS